MPPLQLSAIFALTLIGVALLGAFLQRLALEWTALVLTLAAVLAGWLTPAEALAGFANPATLTVAAMFVLSASLVRTGGLAPIERLLSRLELKNGWQQLVLLALVVGPLSAVISNTAVVAMFIPVVERWSRRLGIAPAQLLMPLSFFTVLAGVGTLLGTSSTLVASGIAEQLGYGRLGLLQFTPLALAVYAPSMALVSWLAPKVLRPAAPIATSTLETDYGLEGYLTELRVTADSPMVGQSLETIPLQHLFDVRVLALIRRGEWFSLPLSDRRLEAGDLLVIRAAPAEVLALRREEGLELPDGRLSATDPGPASDPPGLCLVEALIPPESSLIGQTVMELRFAQRFNAVVLAIRRGGERLRSRLGQVELQLGDALLLQTPQPSLRGLQVSRELLLVDSAEIPEDRRDRLPWAIGLSLSALLLSLWRSDAIVVWLMLAVSGLLFTRVLSTAEIYAAVRWDVVVLLAALLPFTTVTRHSGADQWLLAHLQDLTWNTSPYGVLVGLYLLTAVLTEVMANQAAVAVMLPIGLGLSGSPGLNAATTIAVVTFAASHSFLTPIGYQTNAMVYAVGHYRWIDFLRLGLPLTGCLCLLTPALALRLCQ
ncbi:MAG: SLC13 family permease [Cyanobacteriota bacterium]|nr:SLC13 family permease [Cyanobacteriota bacterium]